MPLPTFKPPDLPDLPGLTLGGWQWWTDVLVRRDGWRVQRHAVTGHHRLLDARNWRHAAGSFGRCNRRLAQRPCPGPAAAEAAVLMHGLGRTRASMDPVADRLRRGGLDVYNVGYASTRTGVDAHAAALDRVLGRMPRYGRVGFVGHSMGNLVWRRHVRRFGGGGFAWGHCVMLAPPNNGSALAAALDRQPVIAPPLRRIMGRGAMDIAAFAGLAVGLADARESPGRVGVVAAVFPHFDNPVIGRGDLVVGVAETRLPGAEHVEIRGNHTLLMRDPAVLALTERFLRTGTFGPALTPP